MARYPKIFGLKPVQFTLTPEDLTTLGVITKELARRGDPDHNRTKAFRWAIRELATRIDLARKAGRESALTLTAPGPMTDPSE